jgi:hypothetical protein
MEKPYVLVNKTRHHSHKNGGYYYRLEFLDTETGELLETLVDELYDNYQHWKSVIESATSYGIYENLKLTKRTTKAGVRVISADSTPLLVHKLSRDEVQQVLESVLNELQHR